MSKKRVKQMRADNPLQCELSQLERKATRLAKNIGRLRLSVASSQAHPSNPVIIAPTNRSGEPA